MVYASSNMGGTPFLRVSSRPVLRGGRDSWERSSVSARLGASSKRPDDSALSHIARRADFVWTRAAFQLCCMANFHSPNMFRDCKTL